MVSQGLAIAFMAAVIGLLIWIGLAVQSIEKKLGNHSSDSGKVSVNAKDLADAVKAGVEAAMEAEGRMS